jgi:hypothetical protein
MERVSHEFYICRDLYQNARKRGAPVVHVTNLGGQFAAETADGKILLERVTGCCKWAMKFEVAHKWLDYQTKKPQNLNIK